MRNFKEAGVNEFRIRSGQLRTTEEDGNKGAFQIPIRQFNTFAFVIAAEGVPDFPWDHVSVHVKFQHGKKIKQRTPTWDEMCIIKSRFFKDDETVIQFHPPVSDYVNLHPHVLHLWRSQVSEHLLPPLGMV